MFFHIIYISFRLAFLVFRLVGIFCLKQNLTNNENHKEMLKTVEITKTCNDVLLLSEAQCNHNRNHNKQLISFTSYN